MFWYMSFPDQGLFPWLIPDYNMDNQIQSAYLRRTRSLNCVDILLQMLVGLVETLSLVWPSVWSSYLKDFLSMHKWFICQSVRVLFLKNNLWSLLPYLSSMDFSHFSLVCAHLFRLFFFFCLTSIQKFFATSKGPVAVMSALVAQILQGVESNQGEWTSPQIATVLAGFVLCLVLIWSDEIR